MSIFKSQKEILIQFGKNICKYRQERNLTIKELSKITGISEQYLKKIERGEALRLNSKYIFIFAKAFKLKTCRILEGL